MNTGDFETGHHNFREFPQPVFPQLSYPGKVQIGSCSLCGGPVMVHEVWHSTTPDIPTCFKCGAVKADANGPVIPMVLPRNRPMNL